MFARIATVVATKYAQLDESGKFVHMYINGVEVVYTQRSYMKFVRSAPLPRCFWGFKEGGSFDCIIKASTMLLYF